ncbi:AbrB Putative ammonia monooxygenase [Burkholderiales bacterium]
MRWALAAATGAWAVAGGALFHWLETPLPWLLGSLAAVSLLSLLGRVSRLPLWGLTLGQISIGAALGLYFTPVVIAALGALLGWMILTGLATCLLSMLGAVFLQRLTGLDGRSCFFAAAIGAASDMAVQAARDGARADLVAMSHTVRVALVVTLVPLVATWLATQPASVPLEATGADAVRLLPWLDMLWVCALAASAGYLGLKLRLPNPWVMGPLALTIGVAALVPEARLQPSVVAGAQVLIGWALGQRFNREMFRDSPRFLAAAASLTALLLLAGAALAWLVHWGAGLPYASAFVATAPGGIAEMAITAKVLALDPPTVTAFQAVRLVFIVLGVRILLSLTLRLGWIREAAEARQTHTSRP